MLNHVISLSLPKTLNPQPFSFFFSGEGSESAEGANTKRIPFSLVFFFLFSFFFQRWRKQVCGERLNKTDSFFIFFSFSFFSAVKEASLRRAPTQNGSDRRRFTDFAKSEHKSELALRPPDRQVRK